MLSYFLWKFVKQELKFKDITTGLVIFVSLIPFYPIEGLSDYIGIAFSHNPKLSPVITLSVLILLGLSIWGLFYGLSKVILHVIKFDVLIMEEGTSTLHAQR